MPATGPLSERQVRASVRRGSAPPGSESLRSYQQRLVAAARDNDHVAAAAINEESLVDATERIRSLLAAQKVTAQLGAG